MDVRKTLMFRAESVLVEPAFGFCCTFGNVQHSVFGGSSQRGSWYQNFHSSSSLEEQTMKGVDDLSTTTEQPRILIPFDTTSFRFASWPLCLDSQSSRFRSATAYGQLLELCQSCW